MSGCGSLLSWIRFVPPVFAAALAFSVPCRSFGEEADHPMEEVFIDVLTDTYVRNGEFADRNFSEDGDLQTLNCESGQSEILLRYVLPEPTVIPDSAFIWIRTTGGRTKPVENAAYLIAEDRWDAGTVTWNTKPRYGEELDAWVTHEDHTIKIDVTKQVIEALKTDRLLSVAIRSPHDVGEDGVTSYHSTEAPGAMSSKLLIHLHEPKEYVLAGTPIQPALDKIQAIGGGQVILSRGDHVIESSLVVHSGTTLRGMGTGQTRILMDPKKNDHLLTGSRKGEVNRDITIRDLTLDGQQSRKDQHYPGDTDRSKIRGETFGIIFTDQDTGNKFERIRVERVEITRCAMGIHFKGVNDLRIMNSRIHGNGCLVGYDHNIYFRRATNALLKNLDISDCTAGNGFNLSTDCFNVILDACDASRNNFRGIRFEASDGGKRMMVINCTANDNGRREKQPGIRVTNVSDVTILNTTANGNGSHGIYLYGCKGGLLKDNSANGNRDSNYEQSRCRDILMIDNR